VLTGDIGTGKTTLCRAVLQSLDRKTFSAFVQDPFASREELLKVLLTDFGVASIDDVTSGRLRNATRTELSYLLYEFLGTLAPLQAFAVVFIDEAQNLSQQLLEEVRILSDADGQLQVVLVGQLELRDKLKQPEMRQLEQRVSVHCELQPLDLAGVAGYISHRLHKAGGSSDRVSFSGEAVEALYLLSGGVPRIINRLSDRALRLGYSRRVAMIDSEIVQAANPERRSRDRDEADRPAVVDYAPGPAPAAVPHLAAPPVVVAAPVEDVAAAALPEPAAPPALAAAPAPVAAPAGAATPATAGLDLFPSEVTAPGATATAPPAPAPAPAPVAALVSEPAAAAAPEKQLPTDLEVWLTKIDQEPAVPPVPPDWRQRWAPTNAVVPPPADKRSGVTLRIPASHGHTHVDRIRRRVTRRLATLAVLLIVLLGAIVAGPATVAASIDLLSEIDERFTPPPPPLLPPRAKLALPALLPLLPPPPDLSAPDAR
jgi:type II secretory pathway predicted ATPase ExeA